MFVQYFGLLPFLGVITLYVSGILIYRLKFHPLAKYPGPFVAKLTSWYDVYHCWRGDRHVHQHKCHQKYGPFVRYGPNYLIVNTANGLRDIYVSTKNIQKAKNYTFLQDGGFASTASVIDKTVHGQKRRILSHAFSDSALKSLETYIIDNVNQWLKVLGPEPSSNGWSPPRNMAQYANYLTVDVLGDLCFGKSFQLIGSETQRYVPSTIIARLKLFLVIGNSPLAPYWKTLHEKLHLDQLLMPKIARKFNSFLRFSAKAIDERIARGALEKASPDEPVRKDFAYWLSQAKDPVTGESFSQKEMWAESKLLIGAGSDTTSVTLASTFFYLLRNPRVVRKLQEELRSTFSDINEIRSGQQLNNCHYLRAVIEESLRISPPVPSSLSREVTDEGITIDDEYLPPGTIVGAGAYAMHHNQAYFRNPQSYWPERWIADPATGITQDEIVTARSAFTPFSIGSRACIGRTMAYMEASIALARVLYHFDIRLKDGDMTGQTKDGLYATYDVFVVDRDGPLVEFKKHKV